MAEDETEASSETAASQTAASGETAAAADAAGAESASPPAVRPRFLALLVLALVTIAVVGLDLLAKQLAVAHLRVGEPVRLLGGAIYLSLTRNAGAAFSMGTSHTWIFPAIAVVVIVAIGVLCRRLRSTGWAVSLGLILGGAIGNLGDRLFRAPGPLRGRVVDFISLFSPDGAHFAIFNLADSALTVGVVIAVLLELLGRHRDGTRVLPKNRAAGPAADATDGSDG